MKLRVIIPYFYPAYVYGGAVFASYNLSKEIANLGIEVFVSTTNSNGTKKLDIQTNRHLALENMMVNYYDAGYLPFFSIRMITGLYYDIKSSDIVHIQSIYSLTTLFALCYSYFLKKPVLLSPRGSLTSWSFNHRKISKLIWIKYLIKPFIKRIYWHATSIREEKEIKAFFPKAKVVLISDGTHLSSKNIDFVEKNQWEDQNYIACLGRIHKVKGFDIIINAMPSILEKYPQIKLLIAGDDEGELNYLKHLIGDLSLDKKVEFLGNINDRNKNLFLKHAKCLVVPSHTENFGIVVVEALSQSTPVIASTNTPWSVLAEKQAGLYVDNTIDEISKAVVKVLDNPKQYQKNTMEVVKEYNWNSIAITYKHILKDIVSKTL